MKDRRILTEETGKWFVEMIILVLLMAGLSYAGTYLVATYGVGYTIGIATAVIVTTIWRTKND